MEVKDILFMNKGEGENSYAKTTKLTVKMAAKTRPIVQKAAQSLITDSAIPHKLLNIADIGCASGPQPLQLMSTLMENIVGKCSELKCQVPEIQFYLNDLAGNDFNTLFMGLSAVQEQHKNVSLFPMGAPGSFHGRLFPRNSMHLIHSSFAVHTLSKAPIITDEAGKPLNKGKIYISKASPPEVSKAYLSQFQHDFSSLLKNRSQELAPNGRMVLIFNGRLTTDPVNKDNYYFWDILAEAASYLVSQGLIDKEKLDSLNVPYYNPSQEEVRDLLDKEDSLTSEFIETIALEIGGQTVWPTPELRMKGHRCFSEFIVSHQFGEEVMDKLYDKATEILAEDWKQGKESTKHICNVVVLKRKGF